MKLIGHEQAGLEVQDFLSLWDQTICSLDIHQIVKLCAADVCLFDLSSELYGLTAYQNLWHHYQQKFSGQLKVFRKDVCIHAEPQLAFIYGYSKIDTADAELESDALWFRSTICVKKIKTEWKICHQHISSPVGFI